MNDKIKPAVIGGVVVGLLSAIPLVNFVNLCCCLWAIVGGVLAAQIYIKTSPTQVSIGEGAMLGAIAGVIGGAIYVLVGVPVDLVVGPKVKVLVLSLLLGLIQNLDPRQVQLIRQQLMTPPTLVGEIVGAFISAIFLVIFSTIGGLLAIPIFEKRKVGVPPPPPSYGG